MTMFNFRDSQMIMNYYEELLDLLEICLKYNLHNDFKTNTPHGNIVSDIFGCILLVSVFFMTVHCFNKYFDSIVISGLH
jgi:hypothetical protein